MNGINTIRLPRFLEGEPLPAGYYDEPDPYSDPPASNYNFRAMVNYAIKMGKQVTDLTKEEVRQFLIEK